MELYFAPMEGITTCLYRRIHAEMFPGTDRYYAPFLAPDGQGNCRSSSIHGTGGVGAATGQTVTGVLVTIVSAVVVLAAGSQQKYAHTLPCSLCRCLLHWFSAPF